MRLALLLMLGAVPARALEISARVDKLQVARDDQVILTVSVSGASNIPRPQLPSMANFEAFDAGSSQSMQIVNGRIASRATYTFVLRPRFVGRTKIPPIIAIAGGKTAATLPIEIVVLRPSAAPPPVAAPRPRQRARTTPRRQRGPDLFVTAKVDKKRPYVNEQILLSVRFHTAVPLLGNAKWDPPERHGFLDEDLPPSPHYKIVKSGRTYYVSEIKLALFPVQAGKLRIGPTTIRCEVQEHMGVDPLAADFFQRFFSQGLMTTGSRELKTKAISIKARPLPKQGRPEGFSGAVGRFTLQAEIDKTAVKVGEAVNLSVSVSGTGNLKTLSELKLPEMKEMRVYETVSDLNLKKDPRGVRGSKIFKTVLVPRASGELSIPAISFSYFDPGKRKYISLKTRPIKLKVTADKTAKPPVAFQTQGRPSEITQMTADIRHLKARFDEPLLHGMVSGIAGALWIHVLPSLIFLGSMGLSVYQNRLLQNPAGVRARRAFSRAKERIVASRSAAKPPQAADRLAEALAEFVADKTAHSAAGLTLKEARQLLRVRFPHLPAGHLDRMKMLWEELEMFRFAPSAVKASEMPSLADGVHELLKALNEEMKR